MTRYLIAANIWLILAVVAILGRTVERSSPDMYSFFHRGAWLYPGSYALIVVGLLAVSAIFFVLTWKTHKKS